MYISIREFYNQKPLGVLSEGNRPLSYVTVLKRVREHMEEGNKADVITIGEGKSTRFAVHVTDVNTLAQSIISKYQK